MSCKVISVVDDKNRAYHLEKSLKHFGWDYEIIQASWRGFGTKLNTLNAYLHENPKVDKFIFVDGYDTFFLGNEEEFMSKIKSPSLISTEINCWPDIAREGDYPSSKHKFKYCNSGTYFMQSELFKMLMEREPIQDDADDQRWMTDQVIKRGLSLDYDRQCFQTLCGILKGEDYILLENRMLTNNGTRPVIIHGNGKANMEFIYDLI
jgi:hypothetical protein